MALLALASRVLRARRKPGAADVSSASVEPAPSHPLASLPPRERRLLALTVSLRASEADGLLALLVSPRSEPLRAAATGLSSLERKERRRLLAEALAPHAPGDGPGAATLVEQLALAPAWVRAHACTDLPAETREALLRSEVVRRDWTRLSSHHPALRRWVRRRLIGLVEGRPFRAGTPTVPQEDVALTRRMRRP